MKTILSFLLIALIKFILFVIFLIKLMKFWFLIKQILTVDLEKKITINISIIFLANKV